MHPLLLHQLTTLGLALDAPPQSAAWSRLLAEIALTYHAVDEQSRHGAPAQPLGPPFDLLASQRLSLSASLPGHEPPIALNSAQNQALHREADFLAWMAKFELTQDNRIGSERREISYTWTLDLAGRAIALSQQWPALLGLPLETAHAHIDELTVLASAEEITRARQALVNTLKGSCTEYNLEHRVLAADGSWKWILSHGRVIERDPRSGRALRLGGVNIDISERKRVERALHLERSAHARSIELSQALLALSDLTTPHIQDYVRAATETAARVLALARASVWTVNEAGSAIVCRDQFLGSGDDAGAATHESGQCLQFADYPDYFNAFVTGDALVSENPLHDPRTQAFSDEYLRPLGISALLDVPLRLGGRLEGLMCLEHVGPARTWAAQEVEFARSLAAIVMHAIERAARQEAQARRDETAQQLRTMLDGMTDRAWLKDVQGRYLAVNHSEGQIHGMTPDQVLGHTVVQLHPHSHSAQEGEAEDRAAMLANGPIRSERRADQNGRWYEIVKSAVRSPDGRLLGLVGISRDVTERKLAEQALRHSEARFRRLTEISSDWYWETDALGCFLMIEGSRGTEADADADFSPAQLIGRHERDVAQELGVRREQLEPSPTDFAQALAEHRSVRGGLRKWVMQDGRERYFRFNLEPIWSDAGAFQGWQGATRDVTNRRKLQASLAQTKERFELALSASKTVVYDLDLMADRLTLYGEPLFGGTGSVTHWPAKAMFARVHPQDKPLLAELLESIDRGGRDEFDFEYRVSPKEGGWNWRQLQGRVTHRHPMSGQLVQVVGTSVDIDSRKLAELALTQFNQELENRVLQRTEALRLSEARFRAVVEAAPVGIAIIGPGLRLLDVNSRLCEIVGRDKANLLELSLPDITHPEDWPDTATLVVQMASGWMVRNASEMRYLRPDGKPAWAVTRVAVVNDEHGQLVHFVAVVADVTERKQADELLRRYAGQVSALSGRLLTAQEEERRQVSRELHDEIGQVLTAVLLALAACRRAPAGATQLEALGAAKVVVEEAVGRVRQLSMQLRPPVLDDLGLLAALRGLCEQHRRLAGVAVGFVVTCEEGVIPVHLNEVLYRVCQEALTNVARYAKASKVLVTLALHQDTLDLQVADNGVGFDAAAGPPEGHLGIVGMRERVKLHSGSLSIESQPGQGTALRLVLPLTAALAKRTTDL